MFIALGGGAYALTIPKNSIRAKQLKKNAVTGSKIRKGAVTSSEVKNASLRKRDFKVGQLPAGPRGPKGDAGTPATRLWAHVNRATAPAQPTLGANSGATAVSRNVAEVGQYLVTFNRDLTGCVAVASAFDPATSWTTAATSIDVRMSGTGVYLSVHNQDATFVDRDVGVAVFCP